MMKNELATLWDDIRPSAIERLRAYQKIYNEAFEKGLNILEKEYEE